MSANTLKTFSLLTGFRSNLRKTNSEGVDDEKEVQQLLQCLQQELSSFDPNPQMEGHLLSKEFMIKLNQISHKY